MSLKERTAAAIDAGLKPARLILSRTKHSSDPLRCYQVLVDGQRSESLLVGETVGIELPAGHHELVARIDWCRSQPLVVEVGPREPCYVEVGSILKWWHYALGMAFYAFLCFYVGYIPSLVAMGVVWLVPVTLLSQRYLYVRSITASERAARLGPPIPHPDALPRMRLPRDLFSDSR